MQIAGLSAFVTGGASGLGLATTGWLIGLGAHLAVSLIENSYVNGETVRLDGALRMLPR